MFLLFSYSFTWKQEFHEQLQHWVLSTTSVPNVIQHKVCREKVIPEYQSLLCWERGVGWVLSAMHHSLKKSQPGSEVNVSLPARLACMIKHEPALLFFSAVGSYSPGNPEPFGSDTWVWSGTRISCYLPRWALHFQSLILTFTQEKAARFGSRWVLCWLFLSCVGSSSVSHVPENSLELLKDFKGQRWGRRNVNISQKQCFGFYKCVFEHVYAYKIRSLWCEWHWAVIWV